MSYDEEQRRRSRIEVETPSGRREVVQSQVTRYPAERRGFSAGMVAAVALTAIAATAIIFLFLMNGRDDSSSTNVNVRTSAAAPPTPLPTAPVIVQTPLTQPTPIIIQQPPPMTTAPPPVVIQQPPPVTATVPTSPNVTTPPAGARSTAPATNPADDATLQTRLDKAFSDNPDLASVNTTVVGGKVMLVGTVKSDDLKRQAERLAYTIKGVRSVENRINVSPDAP